jgi:hypothetical protein
MLAINDAILMTLDKSFGMATPRTFFINFHYKRTTPGSAGA